MANKKRNTWFRPAQDSNTDPHGDDIPAWLDRIWARLQPAPQDPARKIFLERAFDAVIQLTRTLPASVLEETATAGNNVLVLLRALQSPEVLPELERYEPLASPYLKGLQAQQELLRHADGLMTSEEVAQMLGITRQAVDKRRQSKKLIAVPQGQRAFGYPACQFDSKGTLRGLEDMLNALNAEDAWMQLTFLLSPNAELDDLSPLALLREGRSSIVSEVAARFGEHGAL
jgi:hypothetical protein